MTLNVNRGNPDPFYRYKMPPMVIKLEGRGNGKKTILDNVEAVAEALQRPPTYVTKFLGTEFGAGVQVDAKNARYILKGYFTQPEMQESLDKFIRIFVMCNSCDNPETVLSVKNKKIHQKCAACGHAMFIKEQGHKLCTYIQNNPPDVAVEYGSNKTESAKKAKEKKKSKKDADGEDFDSIRVAEDEDDEDDWVDDMSADAVAARKAAIEAELGDGLSRLAVGGAMADMPEEERVERFYNYLSNNGYKGDVNVIVDEATRLLVPSNMAVLFCVEALMRASDLEADLEDQDKRAVFRHFLKDADDKTIKHFLGALEIVLSDKKVTDKTSDVLTIVFDEHYVKKAPLQAWLEKGPTKKWTKKKYSERVHAAAADFALWLETEDDAESTDDEEDDDSGSDFGDDDDELEIDFGADVTDVKAVPEAKPVAVAPSMFGDAAGEDSDLDEDDIDDI